jgi:hypothetical protein
MNAPEIPEWFTIEQDHFVSPLSEEEKTHYKEYCNDNYGYEHWELGKYAFQKEKNAIRDFEKKLNIELFFRWRVFYADCLLSELEKTK